MPTLCDPAVLNDSADGFKKFSEKRRQQQVRPIESQSGNVIGAYGLMGEWDALFITEFPDEKSAMDVMARLMTPAESRELGVIPKQRG